MVRAANVRTDSGERKQDWRTPWSVVHALAMRHAGGSFDFDVAADDENAKASGYSASWRASSTSTSRSTPSRFITCCGSTGRRSTAV